jgi:5'-nucleotidase / UDP-sugar diphosphatase
MRHPQTAVSVSDQSNRWLRPALSLSLALAVLVMLALIFVPAVSADEPITLTILHTNDTHANIQPCTTTCNNQNLGGVARRYTAIQQVKAEGGNVLLIDAGDPFQGTLFFNYWQGQEASYFMNALGYEAMAIGNHEFDSGPPALARFIEDADFPVLSANIDASAQVSLTGLIEPYTIIEVGGESIGVFGLTTEDTTFISSPGPDVLFSDVTAAAQATVAALQGMGINKIVALTHIGYTPDLALAAAVSGIDVIVGGHSHTPLGPMPGAQGDYPTVVNSPAGEPVLVVTAWEWGKVLGRLDVTFDAMGVVESYNGAPILIDASIPEDPAIAADVALFYQPVQQLANTVIGATEVALDGPPATRTRESNLGNLICDAMLWKTQGAGAQICITNGGGIRASLTVGDLTIGNILTVLPFGNQIATLGLTGADVIAALENGVSQYAVVSPPGRFAQVAGMRYSFDPTRPVGERILSADIKNADGTFTPIDPAAIYTIATNDFMRRGGDGYTVFRDNAIDPYDTWAVMADSVIEYIELPEADGGLNGVVTEAMYPQAGEGRITLRTADVNRSRRFNVSEDTFLDGSRPALNFGSAQTMWVGLNDQMRPAVQVPFPVCDNVFTCIPSDAFVDTAYLYLYVFEGRGFSNWNQSVLGVSVHPVTAGWNEATATWTAPWANPGGDVGPADSVVRLGSARMGTWLRLDVTDSVAAIVAGNAVNNGFVVASDPNNWPEASPEGLLSARYAFATTEFFDPSKVGYLRVFFRTYD